MHRKKKLQAETELAEYWNTRFPVGTKVSVRRDDGTTLLTVTRSPAWVLCGTAVVTVDGISGGYALDRVRSL